MNDAKSTHNVFLVGPMGAGKSTIGRRLSLMLQRPFWDSDPFIEEQHGLTIPEIFIAEGEAGFRALEKAAIAELTGYPGIVLATGGGAVLDADNRRCLRERGWVVYLSASVAVQLARTRRDTHRPLLQTADPQARLEALLAQRDPLYRDVADVIIQTDGRTVRHIVRLILQRLPYECLNSLRNSPKDRP